MLAWIEKEVDPASVRELTDAGFAPLLARLLALRGVTPETAETYFAPNLRELSSVGSLPGAEAAAAAILTAADADRKIVVFGDYDCDGICATAILVRVLEALHCTVVPFLPDRQSEGYGLNVRSMERLLREQPDVGLVVTVDNGINSVDEVAALRAKGIEVVVTDHHLPGDQLPACPIVNPKVQAPEGLVGLCGAGVAFFVAQALIDRAKASGRYTGGKLAAPLIVMTGLATVTDIMPLRDINRVFVVAALQMFIQQAPIGLRELLARAMRTATQEMSYRDFGIVLGPRVNAAGRVGDAKEALRLVLTDDREEARELARRLDLYNVERKKIEQGMTEEAVQKIVPGATAQVISLPTGHPGVAGIVAARVLERLASGEGGPVPVCVVVGDHGSARAPEGYNVRDAFEACSQRLTRFGGHAAAGGFSVAEGQLEAFRDDFAAACAAQTADYVRCQRIDAWVSPSDLTLDFVKQVQKMAPFGEANPEPVFAIRGVKLANVGIIGQSGNHLQMSFRGACPRAVWWRQGERAEALRASSDKPHDILFTASISSFGDEHVELCLQDVRPTVD